MTCVATERFFDTTKVPYDWDVDLIGLERHGSHFQKAVFANLKSPPPSQTNRSQRQRLSLRLNSKLAGREPAPVELVLVRSVTYLIGRATRIPESVR